jgi:hypothetical protein
MTMGILRFIAVMLIVAATGCGDGKVKLPTATVEGTVTYRGKPLGTGKILFFHESGQAGATDIAADGTFKLIAFQGKNEVAVECFDPEKPNPNSAGRPSKSPGKSLIPRHYAEAGTSGLTLDVKPGENKATFPLKD